MREKFIMGEEMEGDLVITGYIGHTSGHTPDIYARVLANEPTYVNFGNYEYTNGTSEFLQVGVGIFIAAVAVNQTVFVIPVNGHAVGEQGIQPYDFAPSIPDDLGVSVAINQQMGHQRFPKYEGCHFWVLWRRLPPTCSTVK